MLYGPESVGDMRHYLGRAEDLVALLWFEEPIERLRGYLPRARRRCRSRQSSAQPSAYQDLIDEWDSAYSRLTEEVRPSDRISFSGSIFLGEGPHNALHVHGADKPPLETLSPCSIRAVGPLLHEQRLASSTRSAPLSGGAYRRTGG